MGSKYILNSGGINRFPALRKQFHQQMIQNAGTTPYILLCNFAQPREYWENKFPGYCNVISQDMPKGVTPTYQLAMPTNFVGQCKRADIIYFHGGDDFLLQSWMKQYDIPALFAGKIVVTNSASSNMLAQSYWTCDWRACGDGLNILPIKFIPHYKSDFGAGDSRGPIDWQAAYNELAAYGDTTLPIHALTEGAYVAIEQP
jgi:hypothetical protein